MSGLNFLTSKDFIVSRGNKGNILCTRIPGISLILFYSTQCTYCHSLIPIFKKLPGSIGGCIFGIINISNNKKCVEMSKSTIVPIDYVPLIIIYIDGKPYMEYKRERDFVNIQNFVIEVGNDTQLKQGFSNNKNVTNNEAENEIPKYTIGKPLFGMDTKVCYLDFDNAYVN